MPMPILKGTETEHRDKATHNLGLSTELKVHGDEYRDWQVISVFYSAVHWVQAYLRAKTSSYPQTHEERDRLIHSTPALKPIYRYYQELKSLSVTARYTCLPINDKEVGDARANHASIANHIASLLPPPPAAAPSNPQSSKGNP